MSKKNQGFTIVELLIVIVVIAVLAAISVVAYTGIQERAKRSQANSDLALLEKGIVMARINTNKTLLQITGSNCTHCMGTQERYDQTLDAIGLAAGMNLSALKKGDPWGSRYRIDENEGEGTINPPCGASRDAIGVPDLTRGIGIRLIPYYQPQCNT